MALDGKYGKLEIPGIGDDEPVFIIRAKDKAAVDAIEEYGEIASDYGASGQFHEGVKARSKEFQAWQLANSSSVKVPD